MQEMAKCLNPISLTAEDGLARKVRCRACKGCRAHHQNGWILAAIAESETALETWTVTLTYRGGHPSENWLIYSDVQKMFKRLRKAGHEFRYICAGEYGGLKGRPHWHLMLFFQTPPPDKGKVVGKSDCGTYERRHVEWWSEGGKPIGHVVIDEEFNYRTARYVAKYIQKGDGAGKFTASKKPAIGQEFFDAHARRQGAAGAPPLRNVFKVGDFTAGLSANRWNRYKIICQDAYQNAGHGAVVPHPQYMNTIHDADKRVLNNDREALRQYERHQMSPEIAQNIRVIKRNGANLLAIYTKRGQNFMRLEIEKGNYKWLSGVYHHWARGSQDGLTDLDARTKKRRLIIDAAIDEDQTNALMNMRMPQPAHNPNGRSDLITQECARLRKKQGIPSQAARVLLSSSEISYAKLPSENNCYE